MKRTLSWAVFPAALPVVVADSLEAVQVAAALEVAEVQAAEVPVVPEVVPVDRAAAVVAVLVVAVDHLQVVPAVVEAPFQVVRTSFRQRRQRSF
jgi:hypothetical protein